MNVVLHFCWLFYYAAPAKVTRDETRRAANDVNNRHNYLSIHTFFIIEFSFYFRYGFREPPYLDLALRPCFGGHSLGKYEGTISTVMKHLEKRLKLEFIKVLVCPNMDDEIFPFLHHVPYSLTGMAIRVVEFSSGGYKTRKIFA